MITSVTLLVLSLFALYIGAGWLVKGSTEIALKAKISNLVIGLTIVAFGTSAPELVVSLNASLSGQGDIAVGNQVGGEDQDHQAAHDIQDIFIPGFRLFLQLPDLFFRQLRRPAGYAGINPAPASTGEKRTKDFTCRRVGAYTCVAALVVHIHEKIGASPFIRFEHFHGGGQCRTPVQVLVVQGASKIIM